MVSVIGLGYIGLPTSLAIAAAANYQVIGVDINRDVVSSLKNNELTFQEKGLQNLFDKSGLIRRS
jgi:UDP-N-acetyl-D-mannosaminuronic acid dehydrogenase